MTLDEKTILFITGNLGNFSETFIRAHIDGLPGKKHIIHQYWIPRLDDRGPSLSSILDYPARIWKRYKNRVPTSKAADALCSKAIETIKPDVVFIEYGTNAAHYLDALEKSSVPYVVHFHGYDASGYRVLKVYADRYRRMANSAAAVVAVSREMQRNLVALGFPENRVHYCPCGVEFTKYQLNVEPDKNPPLFLTTGRFVDKKAPYLVLHAFSIVLKQHPEAKLLMIGDGPLWKYCKKTAEQVLRLGNAVEFAGKRPHGYVMEKMQQARAFVQHSVRAPGGDTEGTPVAVMEAMCAGLPVIATAHAGIKDIIEHEKTGYLVEEGDIYSMAKYMKRMIESPETAKQIGNSAKENALKEHSQQKRIRELADILINTVKHH